MLALEVDPLIAPVSPQQVDGLVHAPPAVLEVLTERLVFRFLPADADTETHSAIRQRIERTDLLGYECRLTLRQDQHFRPKPDPFGHGGRIGKHHKRFDDRHLGRIV